MTRDEIIRMAREADDFRGLWNEQRQIGDIQDFLIRFAALVAAQVVEETINLGFVGHAYADQYRDAMK